MESLPRRMGQEEDRTARLGDTIEQLEDSSKENNKQESGYTMKPKFMGYR